MAIPLTLPPPNKITIRQEHNPLQAPLNSPWHVYGEQILKYFPSAAAVPNIPGWIGLLMDYVQEPVVIDSGSNSHRQQTTLH